jgi:hypothetical protein
VGGVGRFARKERLGYVDGDDQLLKDVAANHGGLE